MRHLLIRTTIRSRIIAAFALVLCCTAGLGVFAVQRLAAVNAAALPCSDDGASASKRTNQRICNEKTMATARA